MPSSIDIIISKLKKGELISENDVKNICDKAMQVFSEELNVQRVDTPVTICGDIHGQFYDLLNIFESGGWVPDTNYLFLGDVVDRGFNSIECFMLLIAFKIRYTDRITILRGNHESYSLSQVYGFYDECLLKYGSLNIWRYLNEIFQYLPLTALIDNQIFCVHGGLSPTIKTLNDIRIIERKQEIPLEGSMCDLLWSDPNEDTNIESYSLSPRGAGRIFGKEAFEKFMNQNNLVLFCRAHELQKDGYCYMFDRKLVSLWSAPNYNNRCGNKGAILKLDEFLQQTFIILDQTEIESNQNQKFRKIPDYFL